MVKILTGEFTGCLGVISNKEILVYTGSTVVEIQRSSVEYIDHLSDTDIAKIQMESEES